MGSSVASRVIFTLFDSPDVPPRFISPSPELLPAELLSEKIFSAGLFDDGEESIPPKLIPGLFIKSSSSESNFSRSISSPTVDDLG